MAEQISNPNGEGLSLVNTLPQNPLYQALQATISW